MKTLKIASASKSLLILLLLVQFYSFSTAQVTGIYTDYNGFWKSSNTAINPVLPDNSNNVLGFTYNSITFSTGVNDALLTTKGVTYTASNFKALPVTSIGGTVGASTYIALGALYDGVNSGFSSPLPSVRMIDVLTDGINGLDIGTGVTNIPAAAAMTFPVSSIDVNSINDTKPDILFSQTAQPMGAGDKLYFVDNNGTMVGSVVSVTWTLVPVLGSYTCDLYNLSNATCDAAIITSGSQTNQTKEIRLIGLQLSEFNLTPQNSVNVVSLVIKPGGASDPAFVAFNSDAIGVPSPVITSQPQSKIICPAAGNNATFSVTATGSGLTYQWLKNGVAISGATSSSYTILNVTASDAGRYEVNVTNTGGTVTSSIAYLNTVITAQPSPVSQTIATGNKVILTITATNATSYQWQRNGSNIPGATLSSYTINPLTILNDGSFRVNVINSASGGCASLLSNAITVSASTILYSKSTGNLNIASNWGVSANGSGSTPVDFTRAEHTFKVANRANASTGGDLNIAGTLDVMDAITTITPGSTLKAAQIIRSGTSGTLAGTTTSNLTLTGTSNLYFKTGSQVLKNLTIQGGTTSLNSQLNITGGNNPGIVTVSAGTFSTLDNLTLKSDAGGTSCIGVSQGTITGNVTVERYNSQHKAWRFLSVPTNTTQTVRETWQEGGISNNDNPVPGFGAQLTGAGGLAAGFDLYTATPSLKTYDPNTNTWVGIANTSVNIKSTEGYMVFIRGNRTSNAYNSPVTETVLRTKGPLFIGSFGPISVIPDKMASIGNPYASPIDFTKITRTDGVDEKFYVWDPFIPGYYNVGGYQTLSATNNWQPVPGGSAAYPTGVPCTTIQSGQAFFVHATKVNAFLPVNYEVYFDENNKVSGNGLTTFNRPKGTADTKSQKQFFRVSLYTGSSSTAVIADGNAVAFDEKYSSEIDGNDALKIAAGGENFDVKRNNQLLSVEGRNPVTDSDTIYYNMSRLAAKTYQLRFAPVNLGAERLEAFLVDKYLNKEIRVSLTDSSFINITVNNDAGSKVADRFKVVFRQMGVLPVTITTVQAKEEAENIAITWRVENEINMALYEIEKSIDGVSFLKAGAIPGRNLKAGEYKWMDQNKVTGYNYYRIRSLDMNGKTSLTEVVKVQIGMSAKASISVYPNPVVNGVINLQLKNQVAGMYTVRILNPLGQIMLSRTINLKAGENVSETLRLGDNAAPGIYVVEVTSPSNEKVSIKVTN